jgi:Histidine kinase-, DNA gyrase B-, and HSP90-like ATPase
LPHFKGIRPRVPAVCLTVQDTGCGIKPRHLGTIFDPFFTTKATHKGSGLGLYNAALFAEKHQGCIGVESTEGVGSIFTIWLPQADFSEAERLQHPSMPTVPSRRTILLAGRAGEVVERRAELLRSHSYYVVVATSPESVADFLQSPDYAFDGVLLAVELRDAAFHALAAEIRPPSAKGMKLILEPIGCEPEAFDRQLLRRADLVVDRDLPETDVMSKLKALFSANT